MNFVLRNRQRRVRFSLPCLRAALAAAWPLCWAAAPRRVRGEPLRVGLPPVEATIISNAAIGRIHRAFFGDPSPTDVITFPYGEILVGAETVAAQAAEQGHTPEREATLCLIHGLLHLRGFEDSDEVSRQEMWAAQEKILQKVFPSAPGEDASF